MKNRHSLIIAALLLVLPAVFLQAEMVPIHNDAVWLDTDGKEIAAQGGSMMKQGDTFYWYGFDGEPPPPKSGIPTYKSVKCYTSKNLSTWRCEGIIFQEKGKVPNRLDVVYSQATKKYVMLSKHMDFKQGVGISTCDTPTGTFVWQGWMKLPDSLGGGDQSVFVDDDGKVYLVYTPWIRNEQTKSVETNKHLTIVELTPDLCHVARVVCQLKDTHVEAPSLLKRNGKYYWFNSQVAWWYSSATSWSVSDKLEGPWAPFKKMTSTRDPKDPLAKQALLDGYNSQVDFIVPVKGTEGTFYMYCGDRYSNYTTIGIGRVVWLPLTFKEDTPYFDWYQTWYADAEKGVWAEKSADKGPLPHLPAFADTNAQIRLEQRWCDSKGGEVLAQAGAVVRINKTFYWYGVSFVGEEPKEVRCYSSGDLVKWTYEGVALKEPKARQVRALVIGNNVVLYSREHSTIHLASAQSPTGAFAWKNSFALPSASGSGDFSLFTDDDARSYIIYPASELNDKKQRNVIIAELDSNGSTVKGIVHQFKDVGSAQGVNLLKHKGVYTCVGFSPQMKWHHATGAGYYTTAKQLSGPWGDRWKRMEGMGDKVSSTVNTIFPVQGEKETTWVFAADRFSEMSGYGHGKYVWVPFFFHPETGTPSLLYLRHWSIDVQAGTIEHYLRRYGLWRDLQK